MAPDHFLDQVRLSCRHLIPSGSSVLIAVSGGSDSMALLHALVRSAEGVGIKRLAVAHVNHGLRGAESDRDESFVVSASQALELPCFVAKLTGKSVLSTGVEEWARRERYRFLLETRDREGFDLIATGHTADDQAETVLLRIFRGTGLNGLRAIHARREDGVVRPFLDLTKARIRAWLAAEQLTCREDATNADTRYARNWVRHEILTPLQERVPGVVDRLASLAREATEIMARHLPATNKWRNAFVMEISADNFSIRKDAFDDRFTASEGLRELFRDHGIAARRIHIESVVDGHARSSATILLPAGWRGIISRNLIEFRRGIRPSPDFSCTLNIPGTSDFGVRGMFVAEEREPGSDIPARFDPACRIVYLDANRTGTVLLYRRWRASDRFTPLGCPGPRDIGRFLKNHGIGAPYREGVGVVVSERAGEVVWIPGLQIGETFRLTPSTTRVLRVCHYPRGRLRQGEISEPEQG